MSRAAGGECREEGAGWEGEDGQCDSGIESLRSLSGGREIPPAAAAPAAEVPPAAETLAETLAEERLDSSYGSGALPEALPGLPAACRAEEPPPPPPPQGLSRQQLEALTYVSEDGDTLVHLAIIHCVPAVALCCIAQLPREVLEIQNDLFQTPLHLAVYLEQPSVIQALIHKGVNPGLQDRNGNTPLHLACEQQHLQCAQQLLQGTAPTEGTAQPHGHHQDLQLQNWQGLACLHISTLKGNIPMMSLLLESGANIDVREGTSGKTPLHLAVECHNRRAVQFLLRNGAYVDAQMYNGCTPLHLAVGRKDAAIAAILSHSGADTLLRNMENETAQDLADGNDDLFALVPFDDLKISGKPVVCSE
ncbi:NF-kappa-B inhibitor epsilon [Pelecanus crispus]|uniref:NF-kappa-B inhibitor epsilon n=1 Tax=Pelecanus crispus TaxID=36300 RepID=UPI003F5D108A